MPPKQSGVRRAKEFDLRASAFICGLLSLMTLTGCERADAVADYPNRTIVVIVPWAAGGGTDRVARFIADQLQRELGKPVVVQNQTGAGGASGHFAGARARPDGYTITMGTFELSTMKSMGIADLNWEQFDPLMQVNGDAAAIFVRADSPYHNLNDLLSAIRADPGKIKMSGTAAGGAWDLARAGMLVACDVPVNAVVWVPTQGSAPSIVELLGGHIDAVCCSLPEAASQLAAKQLRALCVMSAGRVADWPEVPTAMEQGVKWEALGWRGLLLPKRTPEAVRDVLVAKLTKILNGEQYKGFMAKAGFNIIVRPPAEFAEFLERQDVQWGKVVEAAGFSKVATTVAGDPGPWALPKYLAGFLVIGALLVAGNQVLRGGRVREAAGEESAPSRSTRDVLVLLAALPVYLVAMIYLGFFISTFVFSTALMVRLGSRLHSAALLSLAMLVGIHLLFVRLFDVILPPSPWGII